MSFELRANKTNTPLKSYGPLLLLIAHTRLLNAMRTSSFSQALIKIYNALYFAQSIQLSNIVLIGMRQFTPRRRVWVLLSAGCANPSLPPTQCSASSDFHWTVN
jgi:hypothetical protein